MFWIGAPAEWSRACVPEHGYEFEHIEVAGLRGKGPRQTLSAPFKLLGALWQTQAILRRRRPAVVLGMGGFVSGPGGLTARALRIPWSFTNKIRPQG